MMLDLDGLEVLTRVATHPTRRARLRSSTRVVELADVRLELVDGAEPRASCYAKVVEGSDAEGRFTIRLTSRSSALEAVLRPA